MKKLSPTQIEVLTRLRDAGRPLVRRSGGFWCVADDEHDTGQRPWRQGEWSVPNGTQVVRAMENAGLLQRTNRDARAWCDPRELTEHGRVQLSYARALNDEREPFSR